jgi:hypothetical protein
VFLDKKIMKEYADSEGKNLEKGFYIDIDMKKILYFTDKYDKEGFPLFEEGKEDEPKVLFLRNVKELTKISNEEVGKILNDEKRYVNWLERKLKEERINGRYLKSA